MSYIVQAEDILIWALLKNNGRGVSIGDVKNLSEVAQARINNCGFDATAKSLYAVVENSNMFKWLDDYTIGFSNEYLNKQEEIKSSLKYGLPSRVNSAFKSICKKE